MVELSLIAGICRAPKEFHAQLPGHGKSREGLRSSCGQLNLHRIEETWHSMSLFSDYNQSAKPVPVTKNAVLIDVQDTRPDSVLFSFGIAEQCSRHEKILEYLKSRQNITEGGGLDKAVLSGLIGLDTVTIDMLSQPRVPTHGEFPLYEVGMGESRSFIHPERQFLALNHLLDFSRFHTSEISLQPDGRLLFTGSGAEMKDLLSVVAEFYQVNKSINGCKQSTVVPYFNWSGSKQARTNSRGSSTKSQTRSSECIKLKPTLKKKHNRKTVQERDLYKKNYFHAFERFLSVIIDKRKGRMGILSLARSGPEITHLLTQFSAGIAGTGLVVLLSVACKANSGRVALSAARLLNTGFGLGLFWLSVAVNGLRDTIIWTSKDSSKLKAREEEVVVKVERSINDVLFRAAALMALAVLRLA